MPNSGCLFNDGVVGNWIDRQRFDGKSVAPMMNFCRISRTVGFSNCAAAEKLHQRVDGTDGRTRQLDVCVSHDMTLYLIRDRLLGERSAERGEVRFLDGLVLYRDGGSTMLRSHFGTRAAVDLEV